MPPRNIFRAPSSPSPCLFFHHGYERDGGVENRWIKRGGKMKREWDTVLRQWHRQRALRMYKGIRLGAAAGEHWFESCFFFLCALLLSVSLFLFLLVRRVCAGECVFVRVVFFFCSPTRLDFISLFFPMCFSPSSIAPHEICKDEHLLSMSWKRASAGETVYNKCPTNATGQSHCMRLANNALSSKKKKFCEIMSQQPKQWKKLFSKMKSKYYKTNRLR